jgi:enamine deaminase RidA (YjgF/YER057c/UK114 family)
MSDTGLVQAARIDLPGGTEIHLAARPADGLTGSAAQIDSAYEALRGALAAHGAPPGTVVTERLFLRDLATQQADARAAGRRFWGAAARDGAGAPATTLLEQPPARSGQAIEIQALAIVDGPDGSPRHEAAAGLPPGAGGRIVRAGGTVRCHLAGLTGGAPGDGLGFRSQADALFARTEALLAAQHLVFGQVARTWIYLAEIDRDYAAFNQARRDFVAARGLPILPASTGIQGRAHPPDRRVALDLVAWSGPGVLGLRPFSAPTMNEAPSYGSDFSRGMRVVLERRALLYVSGTASIDDGGHVVHPGDAQRQARRMLLNIEQLLAGQGAAIRDIVTATTYLKRAADHGAVLAAAHAAGLPASIPHTICVADICRPEWLCEMEAIAVVG